MLRIIEGKIGAGKTFYAVHHLISSYYVFDKTFKEYLPKSNDFKIITNIRDLKLYHLSLNAEIEKAGSIELFFTFEYQKSLGRVIYLIDEAQALIDRKFYNKDVFLYFQTHRHLGHDIYLITQDVATLPKELRVLAEYIIQPVARSKRIFNEFRYNVLVGDDIVSRIVLKMNKDIFRLYTSQLDKEIERPKRFTLKYIIYFVVILGFIYGGFRLFLYTYFPAPESKVKNEKKALDNEYNKKMREVMEKHKKDALERLKRREFGEKKNVNESELSSNQGLLSASVHPQDIKYHLVGTINGVVVYQVRDDWHFYIKGDNGVYEKYILNSENVIDNNVVAKSSDELISFEKVSKWYWSDNRSVIDSFRSSSLGSNSSSVPPSVVSGVPAPSSQVNRPVAAPAASAVVSPALSVPHKGVIR
jgi:hypothetical protein